MLDRRQFLAAGGIVTAAAVASPRIVFAAPGGGSKKLLFVIQRGAADGLSIAPPVGDPAFAGLRGKLADGVGGTKLDSMFALHPSLRGVAGLYNQKQALIVQAVASPYRDRSHFDGQNVLETGGGAAYRLKDGWLNRLIGLLPSAEALALSQSVPMALRGPRQVETYAPSTLPYAPDDFLIRVGDLYASDPQLGPLWNEARAAQELASGAGTDKGASVGELAARMMRGPTGARVAMIETEGWDTHSGQPGRLAKQLTVLDKLIAGFRHGMGSEWNDTIVLVATEFGRTAAVNGTNGTDHGTGAMAMLLGGSVRGGRVVADWPGLGPSQLYQARDLKPTLDLDALIVTALAQNFSIEPGRLSSVLFPDTKPAAMRELLVA